MKKFLLLALAAIFTFSITAQNPQRPREGNNEQRRQFTPEMRAERLAEQLELTAEQKAQVTELYKKSAEKRENNRNSDLSPEDRRAQFDADRKAEDVELEKIIGKEKMEKHLKQRAEREQRMREGGGGGERQRPNR